MRQILNENESRTPKERSFQRLSPKKETIMSAAIPCCSNTARDKADDKTPLIVVECKSDNGTHREGLQTRRELRPHRQCAARETKRLEASLAALGSARAPRAVVRALAGNSKTLREAPDSISTAGSPSAPEAFDEGVESDTRGRVCPERNRRPTQSAPARTSRRALLKQRFNYPVFLYEAEHVGITVTGEPDVNELYSNDHQSRGGVKTCVELYREFRKNLESFSANDRSKMKFSELQPLWIHFDRSVSKRDVAPGREYTMDLWFARPRDIVAAKGFEKWRSRHRAGRLG